MSDSSNVVNLAPGATTASLKNVALCNGALQRAMNRPAHLPGLVVFHGHSGLGKSVAAAYCANKHRAFYVECKSSWTKKSLLLAILAEQGVMPAKTIPQLTDQVCEELVLSNRPLIIDEMDYIVERQVVNAIKDIYEGSNGAVLMIGEERLPHKLRHIEHFHNRILDWIPAQPCDAEDAHALVDLYAPEITIERELLEHVCKLSHHIARRICVNLERIRQFALGEGLEKIGRAEWGNRPLFTGEPPKRREV